MKKTFRRFLGLWVTLQVSLAPAVWGHAVLLHTDPGASERLEAAPDRVILIFDSGVEAVFNSIRVLDQQGHRRDQGEVRVAEAGDSVIVSLTPLEDGPHAVFWRVISLDGHQIKGQFGFGVHAAPPTEEQLTELIPQEPEAVPRWYFPAVRGTGLMVLSLWLGGLAFLGIVLRPALRVRWEGYEQLPSSRLIRNSAKTLVAGAAVFLTTEILWLLGKTAMFIGIPFSYALSWTPLSSVITTTDLGQWWVVRMLGAIALLILSTSLLRPGFLERRWGKGWLFCFALLGAVILAGISATSHARDAGKGVLLAVASDWIHLAAAAIWMGGLFHLLLALVVSRKREPASIQFLNVLTPRFSKAAQYCVLALVATGIYNSWLHIPSWSSFLTSAYGQVLTTKIGMVLVILLIGLVNWRRAIPALITFARSPENAMRWSAKLRKLVRAEVLVGVLVLGAVGLLTNLPPATAVAAGGKTDLQKRAGDYEVSLQLEPGKVGKNQAMIQVEDRNGRKITDARRVTLFVESRDMDMGIDTISAQPSPEGKYQAELVLSMAGRWSLSVEVSPSRGDTFVTEFQITSGP